MNQKGGKPPDELLFKGFTYAAPECSLMRTAMISFSRRQADLLQALQSKAVVPLLA
jgi:hypothetical protein